MGIIHVITEGHIYVIVWMREIAKVTKKMNFHDYLF